MLLNIRWLDIPVGSIENSAHPSRFFVDRFPYSVYRVLQVRSSEDAPWQDVPVVEYVEPKRSDDGN